MSEELEFDAFIAFAAPDADRAVRLHTLLSTVGHSVFVAPRDLPPGTPWPDEIRDALHASRVIVVLISSHYPSAHHLKEEVLTAIELQRSDKRRRLVPVYLSEDRELAAIPHQLTQLHSLTLKRDDALLEVALQLQDVVNQLKRRATWDLLFEAKTVAIVTGCDYRPETYDRPAAYLLQKAIERTRPLVGTPRLRSVVFGDIWFLERGSLTDHANAISIGSAAVNRLTGIIAAGGHLVRGSPDGKWRVMRDQGRWAVFGDTAEDTRAAIDSFRDDDLQRFLMEAWGGRP